MQLINKLFGRSAVAGNRSESSQFQESDSPTEFGSRNAPRRELVQVVLRETMRRHGIPSAWIECRILPVASRTKMTKGMHVQLIVRDGVDRLLTYVPAFQDSFLQEIARFDPRVDDWLFSLSWQFPSPNVAASSVMPDPVVFAGANEAAPPTQALAAPQAELPLPARDQSGIADSSQTEGRRFGDEEVLEDLQALYAIRDASLRRGRPESKGAAGERDFESTHPGAAGDDPPGDAPAPAPRRW